MLDHATEIKSMKLYTHVERVYNELNVLGKDSNQPLQEKDISAFDQLHYHGTSAVDDAIDLMGIDSNSKVLEIGSGLGGPARHIAEKTKASIAALELQSDQNEVAKELTNRCGLANHIEHICGDFLDYKWDNQSYDAIVSWLAIYHIPERPKLLSISKKLLNPGGLYFAEDLYARKSLQEKEKMELQSGLYAAYLPDLEQYKLDLIDAGFNIVHCTEMSDNWTEFTSQRLAAYQQAKNRHIQIHGQPTYEAMEEFYQLVNRNFKSGALGGIKILAQKI